MRVAHCIGWYFPDNVGGSEVYVRNLCRDLRPLGVESVVLAPSVDGSTTDSIHDGTRVLRYPPEDVEQFTRLLREAAPDVFHLHSFVTGAGVLQLEAAREHVARTLTTMHVPAFVCLRHTLMFMGVEACDGRIDTRRCAACWAHKQGLSRPAAELVSWVSPWTSHMPGITALGRAGTGLRATALVQRQAESLRRIAAASDRIVAVAGFIHEALRVNAVPEEKLVLCRQGAAHAIQPVRAARPTAPAAPLRLCFIGRWDPFKGVDVVVRAVAALPRRVQVELTLHGTGTDAPAIAYRDSVARLAEADPRIRIAGALTPDEVVDVLVAHDVLVVPSRWLETGPLIAMEALAAGVPVLGSDLGGLRDLVRHGENGWLVKAQSVPAWRTAIARLAREGLPPNLDRSGSGVQSPAQVAARMHQLYSEASA